MQGVFGLPVSICHSSCLQEPNLTAGWTLENLEHCRRHRPSGPGVGQISAGVARAWLAPKSYWQQMQRSWDQTARCKVIPPPLVLPAARALLAGFWRLSKKKTVPRVVPPGYMVGRSRRSEGQETLRPRHLLISPCNKPNSLYMAKMLTWRKSSNLILMRTSRAGKPTSSHSCLP